MTAVPMRLSVGVVIFITLSPPPHQPVRVHVCVCERRGGAPERCWMGDIGTDSSGMLQARFHCNSPEKARGSSDGLTLAPSEQNKVPWSGISLPLSCPELTFKHTHCTGAMSRFLPVLLITVSLCLVNGCWV